MAMPTWNGQPVGPEDVPEVAKEAFEHLDKALKGLSGRPGTEADLLHLIEATSHLEAVVDRVQRTAIPAAREAGISWAKLGAAMGVSRATAQYRYERAIQGLAEDWAQSNETTAPKPK
jgi:hypothetical protein